MADKQRIVMYFEGQSCSIQLFYYIRILLDPITRGFCKMIQIVLNRNLDPNKTGFFYNS